MCEEYESLHDRSGQPVKVMGQSIVLSEIKTEVPFENDDPANQHSVSHQYEERIERLSQQDKVSKFCMDAGFLSVVEIGQYFMTVNNFPPIQQNSMKNGYDENKAHGNSYENKCATNYSIITNNNKWNDTHNNLQLTMRNKYTNDDVHTDDCVVHIMR